MKDIESYHYKEYSEHPDIVVEVPQVTTLLGAFSDFVNGFALMSTNDYGLRISLSRRQDNSVRVLNVTKQDKKKFQISSLKFRKEDRWANAVKAILNELISNLGANLIGLNITIKGHSAGCDHSSFSAAVFSGLLFGINRLFELNLTMEEMVRVAFNANRFTPIYNARLRDLITIFSAKAGKVILYDLESYEYKLVEYPFIGFEGCSTYLVSSSIPYSVLTPEEDEFRSECEDIFQRIRPKIAKGMKIRDLSEKDIRHSLADLGESQRRFAQFVIQDSDIARKAWDAICTSDIESFARLLNMQQKGITSKAELSSPEIDWIARRGMEAEGVRAMAQVYIGLSGTLLALIDEEGKLPYTNRLEEYERIFGFHADVRDYIPSGGIRIVEDEGSFS